MPVEPDDAIFCPLLTLCPAETFREELCRYSVSNPFPWSIFTQFPLYGLYPATSTVPLPAATTVEPFGAPISMPSWNFVPPWTGCVRFPNGEVTVWQDGTGHVSEEELPPGLELPDEGLFPAFPPDGLFAAVSY